MLNSIVLTVILQVTGILHPIHVSVTDIVYDSERKALEITSHIFIDDIEKHIRILKDEPFLDILNPGKGRNSDQLIEKYLKDRFEIQVNGNKEEYTYLGFEREAGAIYVYIEVEKVRKLKSIAIRNAVILGLYGDQVNLVHIKVDGKIRSLKLEDGNELDGLEYE